MKVRVGSQVKFSLFVLLKQGVVENVVLQPLVVI